MSFSEMLKKVTEANGFVAALDQSGGSTPKALKDYGYPDDKYEEGQTSMFDCVHEMRTRIITSKNFTGDKILGAILFEDTMDREIEGMPAGAYLWEKKNVVPFIKCDKGLADEKNGVQLMKEIPKIEELLLKGHKNNFFGTKMRSVIKSANEDGIKAIVEQQFTFGKQIIKAGLIPIIEPEVDIKSSTKKECEEILKKHIMAELDNLNEDQKVMLKLTLPSVDNHYKDCIDHPNVVRVVALSGGYPRDEANKILARQKDMIASFSRALIDDLNYNQTPDEFDKTLDEAVVSIYEASKSG